MEWLYHRKRQVASIAITKANERKVLALCAFIDHSTLLVVKPISGSVNFRR
jgi:hypothetical protein